MRLELDTRFITGLLSVDLFFKERYFFYYSDNEVNHNISGKSKTSKWRARKSYVFLYVKGDVYHNGKNLGEWK